MKKIWDFMGRAGTDAAASWRLRQPVRGGFPRRALAGVGWMEDALRRPVSRVLSTPEGDGWPFVWGARCRTPRATYPGGGAETRLPAIRRSRPAAPIRSCSRWGLPCRPRRRGRGALLPHPFTLADGAEAATAVCFLWHFPWGHPRRPLTGTVLPWSPDFPPSAGFPRCGGRPSGRLAQAIYRESERESQSAIASRPASSPAVSWSATPSIRAGRKWRWKADSEAASPGS